MLARRRFAPPRPSGIILAMSKPSGAFVFNTRYDPLHLQVFPAVFNSSELDAHFAEVEAHYPSYIAKHPRAHVGLLVDARETSYIDARGRRRIAQTFERMGPLLRPSQSFAQAVVTANGVIRGAVTAILWLQSPPWEIRVFTSMEAGEAWLRETFRERDYPQPDAPAGWWRNAGARP